MTRMFDTGGLSITPITAAADIIAALLDTSMAEDQSGRNARAHAHRWLSEVDGRDDQGIWPYEAHGNGA